jgi:predicted secreted protein
MITTLLTLLSTTASAHEQIYYDRVNLSSSVSREVGNDTLVVVLYAQREGSDLAALANAVNRLVGEAVTQAKEASDVKTRTLGYQSYPIYQKQHITGWRVRQALRLESENISQLTALTGELQKLLAVESIAYRISPQRRDEVEAELIGEAIAAFRRRADDITRHFERFDYRLVDINIDTGGRSVQPFGARADGMMAASREMAPPTLEPGTQQMQVSIHGSIELEVK